jgi:hypothetical protein
LERGGGSKYFYETGLIAEETCGICTRMCRQTGSNTLAISVQKQRGIKFCNVLYAVVGYLFILHSTGRDLAGVASAEIGTLPGKVKTYKLHISLIYFKINIGLNNNNNTGKNIFLKAEQLVEKLPVFY